MAELNIRMSKTMRKETQKVIDNIGKMPHESNVFSIIATFTSKLNPKLNVRMSPEIKTVKIHQDYISNFTDKITIKFELLLQDLLYLYNNRRDLFCEIEFYQGDPQQGTKKIDKEPFYKRKYRAILLNIQDIFKSISGERLNGPKKQEDQRNQPTLNIDVELISDLVYKARKKRLNVIMRNKTIKDAIIYCMNFFGFKSARFLPPDNDKKYVNLVVPPDYGIANIMSFMQGSPSMGVYKNGFCSYVTEDCWYVFPRYGAFLPKRVVQIYSVGLTNFEGLGRYDWREGLSDDVTTHIIVNGGIKDSNIGMIGVENRPNAANVMIDSLALDNSRKLKEDGKLTVNPIVRNIAVVPTEPMNSDEPINITFRHSKGNLYSVYSDLIAYQQTTIEFTWKMCSPFTFHPGTEVCYNYDHQNGYKTIHGKCEAVDYVFARQEGVRLYPWFAGEAKVRIMCPNAAAIEEGCT